nr:hypothetical protein [Abalone asfa-like virus]
MLEIFDRRIPAKHHNDLEDFLKVIILQLMVDSFPITCKSIGALMDDKTHILGRSIDRVGLKGPEIDFSEKISLLKTIYLGPAARELLNCSLTTVVHDINGVLVGENLEYEPPYKFLLKAWKLKKHELPLYRNLAKDIVIRTLIGVVIIGVFGAWIL